MQSISALKRNRNSKKIIILCAGIFIGFFISSFLYFIFIQFFDEKEEKVTRNWEKHLEQTFIPLDVPLEKSLQKDIFYLAHSYDLEFTFVMGLIQQESGFNPSIVSETKDWGLMQINEINHSWLKDTLKINNFLNPYQNIQAGMYMLSELFEKYQKPHAVLMAYNLGETGAKRLWKQKIHSTKYSRNILSNQKTFKQYLTKQKNKQKNK